MLERFSFRRILTMFGNPLIISLWILILRFLVLERIKFANIFKSGNVCIHLAKFGEMMRGEMKFGGVMDLAK